MRRGAGAFIAVMAFIAIFFFGDKVFACSFPPSHYGLPQDSRCLGTWVQTSDLLQNGSVIKIYDNEGNLLATIQSPKIFLDDFLRPASLKNITCSCFGDRRSPAFVLSGQRISPTFSGRRTNVGDIYARRVRF